MQVLWCCHQIEWVLLMVPSEELGRTCVLAIDSAISDSKSILKVP